MEFTLERPRANQYRREKIIDELRRVAGLLGNRRFSRHEFDNVANYCKGSAVLDRFGSWQAALYATGLKLTTVRKDQSRISNAQLFAELAHVWRTLGHRPSKDEWDRSNPRYSYTTYKTRFKGWVNACAAFIEYMSEGQRDAAESEPHGSRASAHANPPALSPLDRRGVPMKLRYQVLSRDRFRCVACGRSPATHSGVVLHIDHIAPYSKGGKTTLGNLRTLCRECNWGKGHQDQEAV